MTGRNGPTRSTRLAGVQLGGRPGLPLLVLGPSLGTSAIALWSQCAGPLTAQFDVLAWDLPGHGRNLGPADDFSLAQLAAGVLDLVAELRPDAGTFAYAGVSVGGAVGLQLLLDAPQRVSSATLLCTGARILTGPAWRERAERVLAEGTPDLMEGSAQRWFAPGFIDRHPVTATALLASLQDADRVGYAQVCQALAAFDVTERLAEIGVPVLAVAGADDAVTPPQSLKEIATGVRHGRLVVIDHVAHLAPAEAPAEVAELIRHHALTPAPAETRSATPGPGTGHHDGRYEAGLVVRRAVLGEAHVERSLAGATELTGEFQRFITEYAWGGVWTRAGLDRRSRSMITLTALVAGGHHEELALHLRAARTNGLSDAEIAEILLQAAIYCGVPAANTAFRIAQEVLNAD